MKKTLMALATLSMFLLAGGASAENGPTLSHDTDIQEIIDIDAKMAEVENKLRNNPDDPSLNEALLVLQTELIAKLKSFDALKKKALESKPAAGSLHQ